MNNAWTGKIFVVSLVKPAIFVPGPMRHRWIDPACKSDHGSKTWYLVVDLVYLTQFLDICSKHTLAFMLAARLKTYSVASNQNSLFGHLSECIYWIRVQKTSICTFPNIRCDISWSRFSPLGKLHVKVTSWQYLSKFSVELCINVFLPNMYSWILRVQHR